LRSTIAPVNELDTEFLVHPPRSLFPSVHQKFRAASDAPADWFNLAYNQRIALTVNPTEVPSEQTDYPLLVNSIFSNLIGFSPNELRFAGVDKIQLEYEIEKFDILTGELIARAKKPKLNGNDIIYLYYDNPLAVDEQNPAAVWDGSYKARYSMSDDTLKDSTGNNQDLTHFGSTDIQAKIGVGQNYTGVVDDYAIRNPFTGIPLTEFSIEFWIKSPSTFDSWISYAVTLATNQILIEDQQNLKIHVGPAEKTTNILLSDNILHHVVVQWRSSDGLLRVYKDGVLSHSSTGFMTGYSITDGGSLVLSQDQDSVGGGFSGAQALNGILDEVKISDTIRSADYITTIFNNENNPDLFYSIGDVENITPLLLDLFPNASAAYSLVQLRRTYEGPAIRVQRTSDSAEQDIGFLADGSLDVASLELFVGASDGIVTIIYDQSGHNMDLDDVSNINILPKIIIAGTLQTSNSLPAMFFDGTDDVVLSSTNFLSTPVDHIFIFGIWEKTDLTDKPTNFNLMAPDDFPERVSVHASWDDGHIFSDMGDSTDNRVTSDLTIYNDLIQHLYTFTKTAGTNKQIAKRDGIQVGAKTQFSTPTNLKKVAIGNFGDGATTFSKMQFQELIFYDIDKFNDIPSIESRIAQYWKPVLLSKTIQTTAGEAELDDAGEIILYA